MGIYSSYYTILVISLIVLVCLSIFFSACEMAFSSLNKIKLKNLAAKSKKAALALKLVEIYDKVLSTVLIGNNTVNISASALATFLFFDIFGARGVSTATAILTIIIILFADITPKVLAKESPESTAIGLAPLLQFFLYILTPINYLTSMWKKLLGRIFPPKDDRSVTEDELLTFVEEVMQEGGINQQEEEMIRHVIEFDDLKVSEIFTPRIDVAAIAVNEKIEEIDRIFSETGYSRLPVFKGTIDNIIGIILFKDFHHEVMKGVKTLEGVIRQTVFVPKTIKISKLLKTLQKKLVHMAVVLDEHGGTLGIVTIEDIVEELVGEIWDEHDEVIERVKLTDNGVFEVVASITFKDMLEEVLKDDAPDDEEVPGMTVANWIMETLGRLPHMGEIIIWRYLSICISRVHRHRVMEVKVTVDEKLKEASLVKDDKSE